jgi:hypothetical protein
MIKITIPSRHGGTAFIFGLTEVNLNRLQFNQEPIFFDFGYIDRPDLYGLIFHVPGVEKLSEVDPDILYQIVAPFLSKTVTKSNLKVFAITEGIMARMRQTPFWGFKYAAQITAPQDSQLIFAASDNAAIERYFQEQGFIGPKTKRTVDLRGFGTRIR